MTRLAVFDVGGTAIKYCAMEGTELQLQGEVPTPDTESLDREPFLATLERVIAELGPVEGVALSVPGVVDVDARYKVSVFSDHLVVTPFFGSHVLVLYDEIDLLEWAGTRKGSGYRDLVIWAGGHGTVRISGMVDVEQILMAIDRFDALPRVKGGILS